MEKQKPMRRGLAILLALCLVFVCQLSAFAEGLVFPTVEITAEAGICYDVDTGGIIFGKNINAKEYPASITKVLTALVVLERCKLDEKVTFSHDAVYNVDSGSSNAEIEEGDVLTVEDCLYALLLKSANEAANALAEHVAGSREAFAELMNEKALALGCKNSNFENPSGLHSENHYTTAYDMALIGKAAMENADFMKIDSQTSHTLAPTKRVPDGKTVYMEHKMLLPKSMYADARAVAGKTGYTLAAGNTLITMAKQDGRSLVIVVMKDKNPAHYTDTAALLDLGFNEYEAQALNRGSLFNHQQLRDRLVTDTILEDTVKAEELRTDHAIHLTLPKGATQESVTYKLNYNLPQAAPKDAVAEILYQSGSQQVGDFYILKEPSIEVMLEEVPTAAKVAVVSMSTLILIGAVAAFFVLGGGAAALHVRSAKKEKERMEKLKARRKQRLEAMEMSEEEFQALVEKRKQEKGKKR